MTNPPLDDLLYQLDIASRALKAIKQMELMERVQGLDPEIKSAAEIIADEALKQMSEV